VDSTGGPCRGTLQEDFIGGLTRDGKRLINGVEIRALYAPEEGR